MDSPFALPHLEQIFPRLARGGHITADSGNLYQALREHERAFVDLFRHLGFRLVSDSRGFYYFEGQTDQPLTPQVRKLAVFTFIIVEALAEEVDNVESEFFERSWVLDQLPHLQRERYIGYLKQLDIELTREGLASIVNSLERFGFVRKLEGERFQYLAPAYRFLDHCLKVAEAADQADREADVEAIEAQLAEEDEA
ncbi:hypothetical protein CAI21_14755 [Alkalilimnicola ehrlichii]|uniref:Chromosome partition protein MukE n=1 Tax=Alkalilimnicola ehrlichii TaxID=351052 RepID=A0A3E0WNM8_9GAMM|nr:hypothetical protein [Alkalilimnicola ehrlichii]RFA27299.1 hypothetical protein CAI21_14755 [Alkalilimnicola ehrlichii]RFA34408.1 hypothetical protein CAL65_15325 [Alkalilimnicola ehrlichii]